MPLHLVAQDESIKTAKLDWSATGENGVAPRSVFFDDIYFAEDGPAETKHVFLTGNGLPKRFERQQSFVIGELGFGTGLNLLCALESWRRSAKPSDARLHFFSIEAHPFSPEDMAKAHCNWPGLSHLSKKLRRVLPPTAAGLHRVDLDDNATLQLFYGDALDGLKQFEGRVDAWFLDGFSPSKNPAMWSPELMAHVGRLSADRASIATFTVAGAVRRALESAGFEIEKAPGFGKKREMLRGRLKSASTYVSRRAPWFMAAPKTTCEPGARIAVIGAGVAGASLAHAARRAGLQPTLFEATSPASGASGNPAGLIMPRLDLGDSPAARFHLSAYIYAVQLLRELNEKSDARIYGACGAILHADNTKERERQDKLMSAKALPSEWLKQHEDGIYFPQAGVVDAPAYVNALLGESIVRKKMISRIAPDGGSWRLGAADGDEGVFDAVVFANSLASLRFVQMRSLPLSGSAGQIDYFPTARPPTNAHAFGPYAAPAPRGGLVIGATYAPLETNAAVSPSRDKTLENLANISDVMPALVKDLRPTDSTPRAAVRCVTPDRMPVAGAVPDWGYYGGAYDGLRTGKKSDYPSAKRLPGLYALTGFGSRGLVTAPLAAAAIVADIAGAPAPIEAQVAEALDPARFFIRNLKRSRTVAPRIP